LTGSLDKTTFIPILTHQGTNLATIRTFPILKTVEANLY